MEESARKLTWFRMYTEVAHDPKVQRLPGKLFKFWVTCLCLAGENGGEIPKHQDIAWVTRNTEEETLKQLKALRDADLIDDFGSCFSPHNWRGRQFVSDVSTTRVKRFRERQRNVSETPPEQIQIQSRADTEQNRLVRVSGADAEALIASKNAVDPEWMSDGEYSRFAVDYLSTGAALIDADFTEAYEFCWKTLDFEQKLERVAALNRHAEEYAASPRFVPKPLKFLREEWERPVRPAPVNSKAEARRRAYEAL